MIYDYLVIGAGPAGCICAGELQKKSASVCVLEKNPEEFRKVCGDGISDACVKILRSMDFPMDYFTEAGAVRIQKYIHFTRSGIKYEDHLKDSGKEAYGLARNKTDAVFRRYLTCDRGVKIRYQCPVSEVSRRNGVFELCGLKANRLIIASGASARIRINGRNLITPDIKRPAGISAIIRAEQLSEPFFMFDYKKEYMGTYAWIFQVGDREYNAGLWLKSEQKSLHEKFRFFLKERVPDFLGTDFTFLREPKGAIMGIGSRIESKEDSVYLIGDACNSSNPLDGEGISLAIQDALRLSREIQ